MPDRYRSRPPVPVTAQDSYRSSLGYRTKGPERTYIQVFAEKSAAHRLPRLQQPHPCSCFGPSGLSYQRLLRHPDCERYSGQMTGRSSKCLSGIVVMRLARNSRFQSHQSDEENGPHYLVFHNLLDPLLRHVTFSVHLILIAFYDGEDRACLWVCN